MSTKPPFDAFIDGARRLFQFLADRYGFSVTEADVPGPEAWLTFQSAVLRITVMYEVGSPPWVEIARLERKGDNMVPTEEISLDLLLEHRGRKVTAPPRPFGDIDDETLDGLLAMAAAALEREAGDILEGNTQALRPLRPKAEEEGRRRESSLFGREPGE